MASQTDGIRTLSTNSWHVKKGSSIMRRIRHAEGMIKQKGNKWFARLRDHNGHASDFCGFDDKRSAEEFKTKCAELIHYRKQGETPPQWLVDWVRNMPPNNRRKNLILKRDIVPARLIQKSLPVEEHLEAWQTWLENTKTEKYARESANMVRRIVSQIESNQNKTELLYSEIDAAAVEDALSSVTVAGRWQKPRRPSFDTLQHYRRAIKMFAKWMMDHERATEMPAGFSRIKVQVVTKEHRTKEGRPLSPQDVEALYNCSDPMRRAIYIVALNTGLRKSEFNRMTSDNIDLAQKTWWVYGKNKKVITLPASKDALEVFAQLVKDRPDQLFEMPENIHKWIRRDTGNEQVKFMDCRHHFGTTLARKNVHPKLAQQLMRHSNIEITMKYYTSFMLNDQVAAVDLVSSGLRGN